jgi:hypothetical protein
MTKKINLTNFNSSLCIDFIYIFFIELTLFTLNFILLKLKVVKITIIKYQLLLEFKKIMGINKDVYFNYIISFIAKNYI